MNLGLVAFILLVQAGGVAVALWEHDFRLALAHYIALLGWTLVARTIIAFQEADPMTDRHPNCALTEEQVRYVRRSLASAEMVARELGVSRSTIQRLRAGTTRSYR